MVEKKSKIEQLKAEKEEYRQKEKVQYLLVFAIMTVIILSKSTYLNWDKNTAAIASQEFLKEEELLIPREQEARQKVAEMKAARESEKSQGSVLRAIIQAKDSKEIEGIHGRLGDLGAIDGIMLTLFCFFLVCVCDLLCLFLHLRFVSS